MPRRSRIVIADVPVHIIQRGIDRAACFFSDEDRRVYLDVLAAMARSEGVAAHAYVLMTNHVHLLVTPSSSDGLSRMMKGLGQRYVQYVNRTYRRTGPLWEGRFRSCIVEAERYLLTCQRYIELNPVRAGMTQMPGDHPWSSFPVNIGAQKDSLITPHPLYLALGSTAAERAEVYLELFAETLDPALLDAIRDSANGGFVLGDDRFQKQIAAMLGRRTWRGLPGRPAKQAPDGAQQDLQL